MIPSVGFASGMIFGPTREMISYNGLLSKCLPLTLANPLFFKAPVTKGGDTTYVIQKNKQNFCTSPVGAENIIRGSTVF